MRLFRKIHVFVPSREGAKLVLSNDFVRFNKGYVKSMADAVGCKSLLCAPHEDHKRIRRLLSDPFSMNAMSTFVKKLDHTMLERFKQLEERKESFAILDFSMKVKHVPPFSFCTNQHMICSAYDSHSRHACI